MLWNEFDKIQGTCWINVLPALVISYNSAPHEAHKKSPYEAFFGFKMHGVYGTPLTEVQEVEISDTDQSFDFEQHFSQVKATRQAISTARAKYVEKMTKRGSVHARKATYNEGDEVAIALDYDNNPKTKKRKLQQFSHATGKFVSICENNKTARVEINGCIEKVALKNLKNISSKINTNAINVNCNNDNDSVNV
jgi:hypothetical protein